MNRLNKVAKHVSNSAPWLRSTFKYFVPIATRWKDQDIYGHVNNVTYYSYFDTAVNTHLITRGQLDILKSNAIGLVVDTQCTFKQSLIFPETIDVGLRVIDSTGRTSCNYEIAIFKNGDAEPAAYGTFTHVWVDRITRKPVSIPLNIQEAIDMDLVSSRDDHASGSKLPLLGEGRLGV